MEKVQALLENAETQSMLEENKVIVENATEVMGQFYQTLQTYIAENIVEFLDETLEETAKNIYVFSSFATKQMLNETSSVYGRHVRESQVLKEAAKSEFI